MKVIIVKYRFHCAQPKNTNINMWLWYWTFGINQLFIKKGYYQQVQVHCRKKVMSKLRCGSIKDRDYCRHLLQLIVGILSPLVSSSDGLILKCNHYIVCPVSSFALINVKVHTWHNIRWKLYGHNYQQYLFLIDFWSKSGLLRGFRPVPFCVKKPSGNPGPKYQFRPDWMTLSEEKSRLVHLLLYTSKL